MRRQLLLMLLVCGWLLVGTRMVAAAGTVGNGTPASCTEAALNAALNGGGDVVFNCGEAPITINLASDKTIAAATTIDGDNSVTLRGAALVVAPNVALTVKNLAINDSPHAAIVNNGGAVTVVNSSFAGNSHLNGNGGAIVNQSGVLNVSATSFEQNRAANGGAIYSDSSAALFVDDSDFTENQAASGDGGAILLAPNHGPTTISKSTFYANEAGNTVSGSGGALRIGELSQVTLVNDTFVGNHAAGGESGGGHALYLLPGATVENTNVTYAAHVFDRGAASINVAVWVTEGATFGLTNSVVADSQCFGAVISRGHNLADHTGNGCAITNIAPTNIFDMYNTNGGRHFTYMPHKNSAARDRGDNRFCPPTDQRGISRPQGTTCDIGAVEYSDPAITALNPSSSMVRGESFVLTVQGKNLLSGMAITWNGQELPTTAVNTGALQTTVPASLLTAVGTVTIGVKSPNRQTVNTLPFVIEQQASSQLVVTVSAQANQCGTAAAITVTPGTPVTLCYQLRNTGNLLLVRHTLNDAKVGTILNNDEFDISEADRFYMVRTVTADSSFVDTVTWAATALNGTAVQSTANATVTVATPRIALATTVGLAGNGCPNTKTVTVNYGAEVTFCYTVTNQGDTPLDLHTISDARLGKIVETLPQVVAPNASFSYLFTVKPEKTATHNITWQATSSALPNEPKSATDTVTVNIVDQDSRDVGALRIWADTFTDNGDGSFTASSRVRLGPKSAGANSKYFSVSSTVTWRDQGPVTGSGLLGTADGDVMLMEGSFSVDTTSGVFTWQAGATLRYTWLGASHVALTNPTLTYNALQPVINGSGQVTINLLGNDPLALNLAFTIQVDGTTNSAPTPVTIKLGGTTLIGQLRADAEGLRISQAVLALPTPGNLDLPDLIIDGEGEAGMRFAATPASISNLNLGNNVLVLKGLTATIVRRNTELSLALAGTLRIDQIRENAPIEVAVSGLQLVDKKFQGSLGSTIELRVEGFPLQLVGNTLKAQPAGNGFMYMVESTALKLGVRENWDLPFIGDKLFDLKEHGAIATQEPVVRILGQKIPIAQTVNLLGSERKNFRVHLSNINATIKYAEPGFNWNVELEATVNFKFGADSSTAQGVKFVYKNGNVNAMLTSATLKVAGVGLKVTNMAYVDDIFTADNVKLGLPVTWGGGEIGAGNLRIDSNGLKIGDVNGKFPVPDFDLFDVLKVSNTTGSLATDIHSTYTVILTTTLTIANIDALGDSSATASGSLRISDGRVGGTVSAFGFKIVGIGFRADKAQFLDDRIKADTVTITLPANLGGASSTISGLEIGGPAGFAIRGGSFKLPDFTVGTVGFQNVNAQFERDANGNYLIGAGAKLGFEAFSVEGNFKLAYMPANDHLQVRHVMLAYEGQIPAGTAIPIADTGFFITRVSGTFDLNEDTLTVSLGVRAEEALQVAGKSALAVEGMVIVQATPFRLETNATTYLVGLRVNQSKLVITSHSIRLDSSVEYQVYRATMLLAFGKDSDDELTMFGSMRAEVGLRKGSIGEVDLGIFTASIPPFDMVLSSSGWEAGKFRHDRQKVWGGRIIRGMFGFDAYVFLRLAPGIGVDGGFNLDSYRPVLPALQAADSNAAEALPYTVEITRPTTTIVVLEAVTQTNWINPQTIVVTSPNGVPFTLNTEYADPNDPVTRIYTVKVSDAQMALGSWQIRPQAGNGIGIWGVDQPPAVESFGATINNVTLETVSMVDSHIMALAEANGDKQVGLLTAAPIQPQAVNGGSFSFTWRASNNEPGFTVDLYAEGDGGMRYLIAHQQSVNETTLSGSTTWTPALPSGIYTPTLVIDDFRNIATTVRKAPINWQDAAAPAAPRGLSAETRADGSVLLRWQAGEADIDGYLFAVDGGTAQRHLGQFTEHELFGLTANGNYQIAVAAYDLSGNVGPAAVVTVGMPDVGVNVLEPVRAGQYSGAIRIIFDQAVTPTSFTLEQSNGTAIPGALQPITDEVALGTIVTVGMRFVPNGALQPGAYTATARASADGTPVEVSWPFTVLPTYHTLTINVAGNGIVSGESILCSNNCTVSYAEGTGVNLTAEAAQGSLFGGWSGACSGTGTCQISMNGDKTVNATFTAVANPTLSVQVNGNGKVTGTGINCPSDCSESYPVGTVVALNATPAQGFVFSGWSGACSGMGGCQVTMNSNQTVSATFTAAANPTLTVQVNGSGTVNGNGINCPGDYSESYATGTGVTLNATPAQGFVFSGWGGACSGTGACQVTMNSNQTVSATFTAAPPPTSDLLYLSASKNGKVTTAQGKLKFGDEDIVVFNPATQSWALVWDGSDVGIRGDLDDFVLLEDGSILFSLEAKTAIKGLGSVADSDILRFVPTSLGNNTAGTFEFYFDGSDVGLTTNNEDIASFARLPDGSLIIGTRGKVSVPGVNADATDLLRFVPSQLGANTAGTWSLYFRGADVGFDNKQETLRSAEVTADGKLYLTTEGDFTLKNGLSGDANDLLLCTPTTVGTPMNCTVTRYWDGAAFGFNFGQIDGFDLQGVQQALAAGDAMTVEEEEIDESDLEDDNDVANDNEAEVDPATLTQRLYLPVIVNR